MRFRTIFIIFAVVVLCAFNGSRTDSFPLQSEGKIQLAVDMVQFPAEEGQTYAKIYFKVFADSLEIEKKGNGYMSSVEFDINISDDSGKSVASDQWTSSALSEEKDTTGQVFFSVFEIIQNPGKYFLNVQVKDKLKSENTGNVKTSFSVNLCLRPSS